MSRSVAPDLYKPYPELVEASPRAAAYEVRDSRSVRGPGTDGFVDLVNRRLFVPFEPGSRATTRHELGHVAWSPPTWPELEYPVVYFLAVEDTRINLGLARVGVPVAVESRGRARVAHLAAEDVFHGRFADYVLRCIAATGTNVARAVLDAGDDAPPVVRSTAERLCRRVEDELAGAATGAGRVVAPVELAQHLGREVAAELAALGLAPPADPTSLPPVLEPAPAAGGSGKDKPGNAGTSGRLEIVTARLEVPLAGCARGARSWRAAEEGSVPRYLHRWSIDRRVFRRSVRRRGGTVLVDTSGSMSFSTADIERIVQASSAATLIAIYSGTGGKGELRIVAKDGRRAATEGLQPFARGNVVDEPCLEWLARQAEPRVWISDGGVTGVDDQPSAALRKRCEELAARGRVLRVKTPEEAAAALRAPARGRGAA